MSPDAAPTPERQRRSPFVVGPAVATDDAPAQAGVRVWRALSSLERLARNHTLEVRQTQAGERLHSDWVLGDVGAREPASGSASSTGWYYPEARLAALQRYQLAIRELGHLAPYVQLIALADWSLTQLAQHLGHNRQEVAGIVKLGLTALADHYGIDD